MQPIEKSKPEYFDELKRRANESRVYRDYQLAGLEIAQILDDLGHKSLYIKLAKKYGADKLLQLAKSIAEKRSIKNKGAYFMKILHSKDS